MEEWRNIEGYEGLYQVSNEGRVKSLEKTIIKKNKCGKLSEYKLKTKILKPLVFDTYNHVEVELYKDSVREHKQIHVLVAQTFISNPHNYDVVHHIDHNPQNNRVENLMWMSKEQHGALHGTENGEKTKKTVFQYTLDGQLVAVWESLHEIARELGYAPINISRCCNGGYYHYGKWTNSNTAYGYRWSYTPL